MDLSIGGGFKCQDLTWQISWQCFSLHARWCSECVGTECMYKATVLWEDVAVTGVRLWTKGVTWHVC